MQAASSFFPEMMMAARDRPGLHSLAGRVNLTAGGSSMDREEGNDNAKDTGKTCLLCDQGIALPYWCETCERLVPEKRCLGCGLKARKVRRPEPKRAPK
jgi:hypothetical protein